MTITGTIAELDPFHNGHKYLLSQVEEVRIVAMLGNFVQRGEPVIMDKQTRAEVALRNGADLVVESPFLVVVQSADYFAQGAVDILERSDADKLAFGTEEDLDYQQFSQIYRDSQQKVMDYLQNLPDNLSYPQKTRRMWETFTDVNFTGNTPNHISGLSYAKVCAGKAIQLTPIMRQGIDYHSLETEAPFASATDLRVRRKDKAFVDKFMLNADLFFNASQVTWGDYFPLFRYQILTNADLTEIFQVNEELASRIRPATGSVATVDGLVDKAATKRYVEVRVRRILVYILVGAVGKSLPGVIHVLGSTPKGQERLKTVEKSVDIVARIGAKSWDVVTQQAGQVYALGNPRIQEQNWGKVPTMTSK